jgi:predicted methyltransferase
MTDIPPLTIDFLKNIAKNREITIHDVLSLLTIITADSRISNNDFVRMSGLPKEHVGRILKDFSLLLEPPSPFIIVKQSAHDSIKNFLSEYPIEQNADLRSKVTQQVEEIAQARPAPLREYDQFLATKETMIKRALHLYSEGELLYRNILFLGDDDHTSLVASSIGRNVSVTVLDIDHRMLESIEVSSQKHNYHIKTILHDLRKPLPENMLNSFDVVFTDPPYTSSGIALFLNRGIQALRKIPTSRLYFCYGNSDRARERELKIQSIVTEKGLLVREKLHHFNGYIGAESIGSVSSLYRCDLTPQTRSDNVTAEKIYTNS